MFFLPLALFSVRFQSFATRHNAVNTSMRECTYPHRWGSKFQQNCFHCAVAAAAVVAAPVAHDDPLPRLLIVAAVAVAAAADVAV